MRDAARAACLPLLLTHLLSVAPAAAEKTGPDEEAWTALFDGRTLDGWKTLRGAPIQGWVVEDGTLHFDPSPPREGANDIYTVKEYADFILELQWKIAPEGRANSGIKYRMRSYDTSYLGPEYQILGNEKLEGKVPLKGVTGALYDLIPVDVKGWSLEPPGSWNSTRIVARGPHIEHWLNGKKVVEVDVSSERFAKAVAASKFKKWPHFARNESGRIMLQDHGAEVWYRAVRLKELR